MSILLANPEDIEVCTDNRGWRPLLEDIQERMWVQEMGLPYDIRIHDESAWLRVHWKSEKLSLPNGATVVYPSWRFQNL